MGERKWTLATDRVTALQNVVDRVSSWQDGATEGVVAEEFDRVAAEVGVDVPPDLAAALCAEIEERNERPEVTDYVSTV